VNGYIAETFWLCDTTEPLYGTGGTGEKVAQSFQLRSGLPSYKVSYVSADIYANGSPTDNLRLSVCPDASGSPDEANPIATAVEISLANIGGGQYHVPRFVFSSGVTLSPQTTYWIVLERTGSRDAANYVGVRRSSAATYYTYGTGKRKDNGSWATQSWHLCFAVFCEAANVRQAYAVSYSNSYYKAVCGGPSSSEMCAQGFRVGIDCLVTNIRLRLGVYGSGQPTDNLRLEICANDGGIPGTAVAVSAEIKALHCKGNGWYDFVFEQPVQVSADTDYFMVLKRTGSTDTSNYAIWFCLPTANVVPSSVTYKTALYRNNGTWTSFTGYAFQFMVYVRTAGLSPAPLRALYTYSGTGSYTYVYGPGGSNEMAAQGFTLSEAFSLKAVQIVLGRYVTPADGIVLKIYDDNNGVPGNQLSGAACLTVEGRGLSDSYSGGSDYVDTGLTEFVFQEPVSLQASTQYYLVLERTGTRDTGNAYAVLRNARGSGSLDGTGNCLYYRSGGSWTKQSSYDVPFLLWKSGESVSGRHDALGDISAGVSSRLNLTVEAQAGGQALSDLACDFQTGIGGRSNFLLDVQTSALDRFDVSADLSVGGYAHRTVRTDLEAGGSDKCDAVLDAEVGKGVLSLWKVDLTAGSESREGLDADICVGHAARVNAGTDVGAAASSRKFCAADLVCGRDGRILAELDVETRKQGFWRLATDLHVGGTARKDLRLSVEASKEYRHPVVVVHAPVNGATKVPRTGKIFAELRGSAGHPIDPETVKITVKGEVLSLWSERVAFEMDEGGERLIAQASYEGLNYEETVGGHAGSGERDGVSDAVFVPVHHGESGQDVEGAASEGRAVRAGFVRGQRAHDSGRFLQGRIPETYGKTGTLVRLRPAGAGVGR
jgi:hypothetical protein